jgi:choloylglycine hydrolase
LVVEELSYSPAQYPHPDERSAINELQWIQYQLDNASSVEEVLASDTLLRIEKFLFGLHYMVADREGSVAVVEFLDGKPVVYTGDDLPVQVLANDTYRNLVRYLAHHEGFGGSRVVSDGPESPERFVRAATLLKDFEGRGKDSEGSSTARKTSPPSPPSPGDFTFKVLESVRQEDTQWSVAYDLNGGEVSFKTRSFPSTRTLALDSLDLSCRHQDLILPLSADAQPFVPGGGRSWTTMENQGLVNLVFSKLEAVFSPDELPTREILEDFGSYPASAQCAGGR